MPCKRCIPSALAARGADVVRRAGRSETIAGAAGIVHNTRRAIPPLQPNTSLVDSARPRRDGAATAKINGPRVE
jgi:hypothetical protein